MPHLKRLSPLEQLHPPPPMFVSHQPARAAPQVHFAAVPTPAHLQDLAALKQLHGTGVGAVLVGADAQLPLLATPPHEDDVGCAAQLLQSKQTQPLLSNQPIIPGIRQRHCTATAGRRTPQDSSLRPLEQHMGRCCSAVAGMQACLSKHR